ncbi:hypothetical protein FQR65_LT00418 [Abscondita terminalis]|nr:hypothetical protein FQR65_LT00418 [Abscondita terminalis]
MSISTNQTKNVSEEEEGFTYEILNVIGRGAYGTVYKARDKKNGTYVALKKVRVFQTEDGIPSNTLREISLLKQLDAHEHPNIVRFLNICHGQRSKNEHLMFLIFEFIDQDLASFIHNWANSNNTLSNDQIRNISREILTGVDFLHSYRIVHRDLKPQNILITQNRHIKLADFGLAKTYDFQMKLTNMVVTLWYRPPEVLLSQTYATPVDLWSVGCIIAELFMLKPLFCGTSEGGQLSKIFQILGKPREDEWPTDILIDYKSLEVEDKIEIKTLLPNISESAFELIMRMLIFNPLKRISALEALTSKYFLEEPLELELIK